MCCAGSAGGRSIDPKWSVRSATASASAAWKRPAPTSSPTRSKPSSLRWRNTDETESNPDSSPLRDTAVDSGGLAQQPPLPDCRGRGGHRVGRAGCTGDANAGSGELVEMDAYDLHHMSDEQRW